MAKLRMTYKTLKALRKSREYQALLIDLVNESVVSKAVAENLLGYNIPSDLLPKISSAEQTEVPVNGGTEGQGSGTEGQGSVTVTLLYFDSTANDNAGAWLDHTYTPTSTDVSVEGDAIIAAAKTAFSDNTINALTFAELNNEYVEGTSDIELKYSSIKSNNWPTTFTNGDLIVCYNASSGNKD